MSQELGQNLQVKLLSWPTPQEYNEAVQNVALTFGDADLKAGKPELNLLGIPKPITGAFASVYRVHCWDVDWAVRCFLHNIPDQQERYARIEEELDRLKLPYMVGFDYQDEGIRLHGDWYPILKMEWADGEDLSHFIEQHHKNAADMCKLVDRWRELVIALHKTGIAHGDLQHGNVLVYKNSLKLVDYDGMYVPALAGRSSNELGHRNYQHPGRSKEHYGPYLDNFSAWVIYTSLLAVSIDPKLWEQLKGGDECLLFRQSDFINPLSSPAFALLEKHRSREIKSCARHLRSFLKLPVDQVPSLDSHPAEPKDLEPLLAPKASPKSSDAAKHTASRPSPTPSQRQLDPEYLNPILPAILSGVLVLMTLDGINIASYLCLGADNLIFLIVDGLLTLLLIAAYLVSAGRPGLLNSKNLQLFIAACLIACWITTVVARLGHKF